ncbi:LytR/AlgR family response regulator transcription factor [Bacteroides nordii]|uniref:LytR/AlgR family response regulator transcription factor n=1 Tax=Bacteroides nordii TaxID=291645 RepID=UPI0039997E5B
MSTPTKVIIIDDDKPSVTVLANELKVYQDVVVVATAFNSHDGEQAILKHKPQLIFLDIELPSINGLEFLATLRSQIDWEMNIIFYTSYEKYMLQALRMQAFDFLLKPVNPNDLLLAMNRYYVNRKNAQPSSIPSIHYPTDKPLLITTITNDKIILRPQNIGYFRYNSERKLWEIVLDDFRHVILKHNTTADVILNYGTEFIQIHKTYIININYLSMIQENACIMLYPFNTVTELKVSKMYRKKLFEKFYNL